MLTSGPPRTLMVMNHLSHVGLIDLIIGLIIVASVIGALRRRAGIIAALASGVGTAVVLWLIAGGLIAWAPAAVGTAVGDSALVSLLPPPTHALHQLGDLVARQFGRLNA